MLVSASPYQFVLVGTPVIDVRHQTGIRTSWPIDKFAFFSEGRYFIESATTMADPLSVTASIIAVVGVAHEVTKGLRRLKAAKDAPEDLKDLLEDLVQLEMVLNGIKSGVLSPGSPPVELASLIEEAGSKLLELRSLIEYTLTKAGVSDKVVRWQWLRKGDEVERLRNQLSAIRLNLVALTSSANL